MTQAYMPESKSTEWGTPRRVFDPWNSEFNFTLDVCAVDWNTKVPGHWFSPQTDGLRQSWRGERAWCNPPYGSKNIAQWLAKAVAEANTGATSVLLLPNTTDTLWFHEYVWDTGRNRPRRGIEIRFIKGRINFDLPPGFDGKKDGNVKGSILVITRPIIPGIVLPCQFCGK